MKIMGLSVALVATGLCLSPAFAEDASKQKTQYGSTHSLAGPAAKASKQKTQDGGGPPMVGPASKAYKQQSQGLSHADPASGVSKQN